MAKVVNFYKGLPNGPAPAARSSGYQARHFDGKNSDMTPVFQTIAAVFALSYTIDYHFHLSRCLLPFLVLGVLWPHVYLRLSMQIARIEWRHVYVLSGRVYVYIDVDIR